MTDNLNPTNNMSNVMQGVTGDRRQEIENEAQNMLNDMSWAVRYFFSFLY